MKQITLKVDGEDKIYKLKPLDWDNYPKLFTIATKFNGSEKDIMSKLDEKTIIDLRELELIMFKISYPEMPLDEMKKVVQQNIFELLEPLIELNFKFGK